MAVSLAELKVLILDCQTTGANPHKGHLLEIGWMPMRAADRDKSAAPAVRTFINRLPAGTAIPKAVSRITGISEDSQVEAQPSAIIWQHLKAEVEPLAAESSPVACPTVIHFARFETPFLRDFHRQQEPEAAFPFRIICTHEIAVRLLPDLPRRGLRAVAGYFNHSVPELKRSADHVAATATVWGRMVELLDTEFDVRTPGQLADWLASTQPSGRGRRVYPMASAKRRRLPDQPGVYRMLRANGDLLYIGKAKSLKRCVSSYFRPRAPHAEHTLEMLSQAREIEFTLTGSALEAAMLESDEIKRRSPPYNKALRGRQRRLVFGTKDLSRFAASAGRDGTIGPLPDGSPIEAIAALGHWIRQGCNWSDRELADRGPKLFGLSTEAAPDPACLRQGLAIFREDHTRLGWKQSPLRLLTGLGARLWRQRLAAAIAEAAGEEPADSADVDGQAEDADAERVWTPEAVVKYLEHQVLHGAHLVRRARWFCLLGEASLAWQTTAATDGSRHLIVLVGGAVTRRETLAAADGIPIPPRCDRSFRARQIRLNLATYDRLRVLTTEMRRLISASRPVELRLRPSVTLGNDELEKALRWV